DGYVEGLTIIVAEGKIRHATTVGSCNRTKVFALGRYHPSAAGTGTIKVALQIHFHAVEAARRSIAARIDKHFAVAEGVVGKNVVAPDFLRTVRVEIFFVWRNDDSVRSKFLLYIRYFAVFDHPDAAESQF